MCSPSDHSPGQKKHGVLQGGRGAGEAPELSSPSCQEEFNCLWPPIPGSRQTKQTTAASPPPLQHQQDLGCSLLILFLSQGYQILLPELVFGAERSHNKQVLPRGGSCSITVRDAAHLESFTHPEGSQAEGNSSLPAQVGKVRQRNAPHSHRSVSLQRAQSSFPAGVTQSCVPTAWDSKSQKALGWLRVQRRCRRAPKSHFQL